MEFLMLFNVLFLSLYIFLIVREIIGRNNLGKRILKVKQSFLYTLSLFILSLILIFGFVFIIVQEQIQTFPLYGFLSLSIMIYMLIRMYNKGSVHEKGILTLSGYISYHDIQTIKWTDDGKIEITYNENLFQRTVKEKWKVPSHQKETLKALIEEKHFI